MARVEAVNAISTVWNSTLASYKDELSPKEYIIFEGITSPTDIADHVKGLEAKRRSGKRGAFADKVDAITTRLTQFSSVIDILTSSNTEASLIWGSLKLLLTIVHRSAQEYDKICRSIEAVSNSFPTVELVAATFEHSELVGRHVATFYECVLKFWSNALKFYKRRRIFNIFRAWHDFDSEFGDLERDMKRHGDAIQIAAAAVHMNESRRARTEQSAVNRELIEATRSAVASDRHRDIAQWLAPSNYEASYFSDDLRSACESRHPGTCTWILDRPEFKAWTNSDLITATTRMLWLTGIPGAGKTVLSSFVIDRCSEISCQKPSASELYFFFKMTDSDKNSVLAVTRSLIYQLYSLFPARLASDIISLRDGSGKDNALSDQRLWDLFVKHAKDIPDLFILLDALDECVGVDVLLRRLKILLQVSRVKIFVVSRREEEIAIELENYPHIFIGHECNKADIHSYVTTSIEEIPRFRGKSVQQRMISALSSGHGGMFLWAYLMIKELKELGTAKQVDDALSSLPKGLEDLHERIITRLDANLRGAHRQLAISILMWVVCAVRPLRLVELQEILRFEIGEGITSGPSFVDDDDFWYSEKDIELACGALVVSRNQTLQLVHLSTKEILTRRPLQMPSDDPRLAFYVDVQEASPHMATQCLSYIKTHLDGSESLTRPNLEAVPRLQLTEENYDSTALLEKSPFIDYASISWQVHLIDSKFGLGFEIIMRQLQLLLTYDLTKLWIELCVVLHEDAIWITERSCKETVIWADSASAPANSSMQEAISFVWAWSNAVLCILNEYGGIIEKYPYEIHYLDLSNVLGSNCEPGSATLPESYAATQIGTLREQIFEVRNVDKLQASVKVEPCRQLPRNMENSQISDLGFLLYDSTREVYFTAERKTSNRTEVLWVQERKSGRRLQPVKSSLSSNYTGSFPFSVIHAVLSPDHTYIAILYATYSNEFVTSIWIIESHLDFLNMRNRRPWARRLHHLVTENVFFRESCLPLTVGRNGMFYSPSGQIHSEHGVQNRIPASLVDFRTITSNEFILAFAGNGETIISLDRTNGNVEEFSWLEKKIMKPSHSLMPLSNKRKGRVYLRAISQTAQFMVYEDLLIDKSAAFYLLDRRGNMEQLQVDIREPHMSVMFFFSHDERHVSVIYGASRPNTINLSRWPIDETSAVPQQPHTRFIPDLYPAFAGLIISPCMGNVHVANDSPKVLVVTTHRVLHELEWNFWDVPDDEIATQRYSDNGNRPHCQNDYRLSKTGSRVVGVYTSCDAGSDASLFTPFEGQSESLNLSKTRTELRFAGLSGATDQIQTIELDYVDSHSRFGYTHSMTFSPDLSMLHVGQHIFDLVAPGQPQLWFPDCPFPRLRYAVDPSISFSPCNGYLTCIKRSIKVAAEDVSVDFGLFQICRNVGSIERLSIAGLEDLMAEVWWADFHPTLPLLMLTGIAHRRSGVKRFDESIRVIEIDLEALRLLQITLPETIDHWGSFPDTRARYSDCGSFCFLQSHRMNNLNLNSNFLEKMGARVRLPAVWGPETLYNGRFYHVRPRDGLVAVDKTGPVRGMYPLPRLSPSEIKITVFPNHLASARMFLLSGKDENDFVRVLFLPDIARGGTGPPEVKYLRVTLNQILKKLKKPRTRVKKESSDGDMAEAEADASEDSREISDSGSHF